MPRRYRLRAARPAVPVPAWVLKFLATGERDRDLAGFDYWIGPWSHPEDMQPLTPQTHPEVRAKYIASWAKFGAAFEAHRAEVEALCPPGKKPWFVRRRAKAGLPKAGGDEAA